MSSTQDMFARSSNLSNISIVPSNASEFKQQTGMRTTGSYYQAITLDELKSASTASVRGVGGIKFASSPNKEDSSQEKTTADLTTEKHHNGHVVGKCPCGRVTVLDWKLLVLSIDTRDIILIFIIMYLFIYLVSKSAQ